MSKIALNNNKTLYTSEKLEIVATLNLKGKFLIVKLDVQYYIMNFDIWHLI